MGGFSSRSADDVRGVRAEVLRELARLPPGTRVDLLSLGPQGVGKSCLNNTWYFSLHDGDRSKLRFQPGGGKGTRAMRRGTTKIRCTKLCDGVFIWDVPGMNFNNDTERALLDTIVQGIDVPDDEFDLDDEADIARHTASLTRNAAHAIDASVWVLRAPDMERPSRHLLSRFGIDTHRVSDTSSLALDSEAIATARRQSRWKLHPFVVFTHMDLAHISAEELKRACFQGLAEQHKFCLTCYTAPRQLDYNIDFEALSILNQMLGYIVADIEGRQ